MPNGGSDCCGTCWFNRTNEGKAGYPKKPRSELPAPHCEIRGLDIRAPFYTYCANHPHRNPGKVRVPIGPVFTGDSFGNRRVWQPCPDTEETRQAVLDLLGKIPEQPTSEYPIGLSLEVVIIGQVAEWGEKRALPGLERIMSFRDMPGDPGEPFARDQESLRAFAKEAHTRILQAHTGQTD